MGERPNIDARVVQRPFSLQGALFAHKMTWHLDMQPTMQASPRLLTVYSVSVRAKRAAYFGGIILGGSRGRHHHQDHRRSGRHGGPCCTVTPVL